jgi:hypothetical protein
MRPELAPGAAALEREHPLNQAHVHPSSELV